MTITIILIIVISNGLFNFKIMDDRIVNLLLTKTLNSLHTAELILQPYAHKQGFALSLMHISISNGYQLTLRKISFKFYISFPLNSFT